MRNRGQRVDDLVRGELSRILQREVKDPRVKLATITEVTVSRDLRYAEVRVSVLGEDHERSATLAALQAARGFFRSQLAHSLRLRTVPELTFELDRGAEYSQRISDLLESLHDDVPGAGAPGRPDP